MIEVRFRPTEIRVTGHAGAGPPGHDLVCAAISTLVDTLNNGLDQLTYDKYDGDVQPGRAVFRYRDLSVTGHALVDSFFIGVEGVAEAHPDFVRILPGGTTEH